MNRRKTSLPTKAKAKAASIISNNSKLKKPKVKDLTPYLVLGYIITIVVTFTLGVYLTKADDTVTVLPGIDNNDDHLEIVSNAVPIEGVVFYKNPKTKVYGCGYPGWRKLFKGVFPELADKIENGTILTTENGVFSTEDDVLFMGTSGSCFQTKGYVAVHDDERYELSIDWISEHFKGHVVIVNGETAIEGNKWSDTNDLSTIPKRMYMIGTPGNGCQSRQLTLAAQVIQTLGASKMFQGLQPKPTSTKERFLLYTQSNCVDYRNQAFSDIAKRFPNLTLEYGARCAGIRGGPKNIAKRSTKDTNVVTISDIMTQYRFCLVMENEKHEGYISEKIINAFTAGCIPIYYGTIEIFDVFNPKSFIYYDIHDPAPALKKIEMLENNEIEYAKVMAAPILLEGNATFHKYFSLSDEMMPNAKLKKEIRNMVNYRCKYDE